MNQDRRFVWRLEELMHAHGIHHVTALQRELAERGIDLSSSQTPPVGDSDLRPAQVSLGELADFSGAEYDGDFSLSLEEAQRRKQEYVAQQIGIGLGRRVLESRSLAPLASWPVLSPLIPAG